MTHFKKKHIDSAQLPRILRGVAAVICFVVAGVFFYNSESFQKCRKAIIKRNPVKCFEIAQQYANGDGVEKNPNTAFEWLLLAAENGHAPAQSQLGNVYYLGKNKDTAIMWFLKAAEQNDINAQSSLGWIYAEHQGAWDKAKMWLTLAAEKGDKFAQVNLAFLYSRGYITPLNEGKTTDWLLVAKQHDWTEYVIFLQNAAQEGDALSQNNLGFLYLLGLGVEEDLTTALKWLHMAARQGNETAQYHLGWCYAMGVGVNKNISEAEKWYQKSSSQGNMLARTELVNIKEEVERERENARLAEEKRLLDKRRAEQEMAALERQLAQERAAQEHIQKIRSQAGGIRWNSLIDSDLKFLTPAEINTLRLQLVSAMRNTCGNIDVININDLQPSTRCGYIKANLTLSEPIHIIMSDRSGINKQLKISSVYSISLDTPANQPFSCAIRVNGNSWNIVKNTNYDNVPGLKLLFGSTLLEKTLKQRNRAYVQINSSAEQDLTTLAKIVDKLNRQIKSDELISRADSNAKERLTTNKKKYQNLKKLIQQINTSTGIVSTLSPELQQFANGDICPAL